MFASNETGARPLWLVGAAEWSSFRDAQPEETRRWLDDSRFRGERLHLVAWPGSDGRAAGAVLGAGGAASKDVADMWLLASIVDRLPPGPWRIANHLSSETATTAALGWSYGSYRFDRYRSALASAPALARPTLVPPASADMRYVGSMGAALAMARDLINTPACDMSPERLAEEALAMASRYGAEGSQVVGVQLREGYPAIHAVGRAAACAPRLIDFAWGDPAAPKVTLVGKGVCFDTGGLDLKTAPGMLLMKKDMGGAACTLALARVVMEQALPVRLRVLVPAVENAVSGDAYRPGDVLRTRKGVTVEVGNTDAEGRLVLCDALAAAEADAPELLVDLATLTGAARIALGPELPALFGLRENTVQELATVARAVGDPLWPMPLWAAYEDDIASKVADVGNASQSTFAGAILGALFLRRFVAPERDWLHVDLYAWNGRERPGRPVGAEPQSVRALYALLAGRYH